MQVYDEFVIRENMAIMRCHVPSIVREYVRVVAWLRDEQVLVTATHNPRKCFNQLTKNLNKNRRFCCFSQSLFNIHYYLLIAHTFY